MHSPLPAKVPSTAQSTQARWQRCAPACYRLWNASACEALVAEHYPSFLDFYRHNITLPNEKSDMMRYIVLHRYGGEQRRVAGQQLHVWPHVAGILAGPVGPAHGAECLSECMPACLNVFLSATFGSG